MPNTKANLLNITNLKKYFPIGKRSIFKNDQMYVRANDGISLEIHEGETLGLVGESGCGKSTFGRVILQLYPQTSGSTMYYGKSLAEIAPKYVVDTLKNADKMVSKYHELREKADEAALKLEEAGEGASFELANEAEQAEFAASNALDHTAKILGGFMALQDISEPAAAMLELFEHRVKLAEKQSKLEDLEYKKSKISPAAGKSSSSRLQKLDNSVSETEAEIEKLEKEILPLENKVEQLKAKYSQLPDFEKYEALRDQGIDLSRLSYDESRSLRKDLQIIFQDPYSSLNPRLTIGQIIEEGIVTHKMYAAGSDEAREYVLKVMEECGLQNYMLHRYPYQFSGGQRQRICIARALAVKPKFLVCDECVSALDVSIQSQIINLLLELKEKQNLTYLFISHDLSVVKYISDRIGVMYLGNIVELTDKDKLFSDPRHPYTIALLSSIPTTDPDSAQRDRIILEGNIPSPINPPSGCKFHTRCYMACDKCRRINPPLVEVEPGHFVACHYSERKLGEDGELLFDWRSCGEDIEIEE